MHNRFTITIHDDNGVKQFNLHRIVKKVVMYVLAGLFLFFLSGAGMIVFLNHQLANIQQKKAKVEDAYTELRNRNESLQGMISQTEEKLAAKKEELDVVSDRLENIETLIGLAPAEKTTLAKRVETAHLTSGQMAALLQYIPSGSPVEYKGITSKFGYRMHPTLARREFHRGSDLRAEMNTPVYATANGVVEFGSYHQKSGFGKLVIIDHNYGFKTMFAHLNKIVVKSGQYVKKGDLIAYTGNSGMSSGPHLHYEIRYIQRALNPFWFIKWNVTNYRQIFEKEKQVPWQSLVAVITNDRNLQTAATPTQTQP